MSTGHVVVEGAICKCKFGFTPDSLVVQTQNKAFINDSVASKKLIGNTMDLGIPFQAKTFGKCKLQPTSSSHLPCVPAITQWTDFYDKVYLSNNGQILTEKSKATCAIAGSPCIEFIWHGQTAGIASTAIEEADEEVQSQLNPLVNTKKMEESYDNHLEEGNVEPQKEKEKVISVNSELYLGNDTLLKTPYLHSTETINFESSKPFIIGLKAIFGDTIKHTAIKQFKNDLEEGKIPLPEWKIERSLSDSEAGFHKEGTIHLNEKLILKAEKDPATNWLLFRVIIEEIGHYIDYLLRNQYDTIGGDAPGDEGTLFAADFIKYNKLLTKDFEFATFHIKSEGGSVRKFIAKVSANQPNREQKAKELLFIEDDNDDHGIVTLNSGEQIKVEFFKIRGMGAVHENITKQAAEIARVVYDYRLDEGVAWPDAPCESDEIETCYVNMIRFMDNPKGNKLAYRSHNGDLSYWHSMAPPGDFTNEEVVDLIIKQAKKWYEEGINTKNVELIDPTETLFTSEKLKTDKEESDGLFHIGKILHMVQDSYSEAHVIRNDQNEIIQIQSYTGQDEHKHGVADAVSQKGKIIKIKGFSPFDASNEEVNAVAGALDARKASIQILTLYKNRAPVKNLEKFLRDVVYKFGYDKEMKIFAQNKKTGGTSEKFKHKDEDK
ncbi:MAG: DUF4280 domain-containing protein [Flavobacteriaceae bacterium]|nr:DUF4280 domain-containing protein [Flavobacteriaceae bacterium]